MIPFINYFYMIIYVKIDLRRFWGKKYINKKILRFSDKTGIKGTVFPLISSIFN